MAKREICEAQQHARDINERLVFARRLRAARLQKGLSQAVLSELCGLHRGAVSEYERGKKLPGILAAVRLARRLGVEVAQLLDAENF